MTQVPPNPGPMHHIGVVVDDLEAAVAQYRALGFVEAGRERIEEQNVDIVALRAGVSWVELLAPLDHDSALGRFLAKRGAGIHHVAYLVDDLPGTLAALAERGVELIDQAPRVGLHGWHIAFVHPRASAGVLTELVDRASTEQDAAQH